MIIFTGISTMTMRPMEDPADALGVVATLDALDEASTSAELACLI